MDEQLAIQPMKLNPEVAQNQVQRLNELRANRNSENVQQILKISPKHHRMAQLIPTDS